MVFKKYLGILFLVTLPLFLNSTAGADVRDSVLKVYVTSNSMDFYRPWQSLGSTSMTGSASILPGNRILTNAHVVSDHTFIQVRKVSDPQKYTARVLAIGYDCDLALLTVDDPEFFKGITPLELGDLPKIQDSVVVIGYPEGGDKLSVTEGVVSRIEITPYVQSNRQLLTVQIDAAINSGNSGGPVVQRGKLIGIAMQGMADSQNIGYMIPSPVINHFFSDLDDGKYDGFPALGIEINNTENKTLREFYKIGAQEGGVLISKVMPGSPAHEFLKGGDIILDLDGIAIGVDGTFQFRESERLSLSHIINEKQLWQEVKITYVRDGKSKTAMITLAPFAPLVLPPKFFAKPPYYIYGGLVFTVVSIDLLKAWGSKWWEQAPLDVLYYLAGVGRLNEKERKELVILTQVLPDNLNVGYHNYQNEIITKVNGVGIKAFQDFVSLLHHQKEKYLIIETENNLKIILDSRNIDKVTKEILKRNNISFQYSDDVAEWLKR